MSCLEIGKPARMIVWGIELKETVSSPAGAAAAAMGTAAQQAKTLQRAMAGAQAQAAKMAALGDVAGVRKAVGNYRDFAERLEALSPALQQQAQAQAAADAQKAHAAKAAEEAAEKAKLLAEQEKVAFEQSKEFAETLRDRVVTGAKVAAVALVALGAAVYESGRAAVEASEDLHRMTAVFDALGASAGNSGKDTIAMIRNLSSEIPQSEAVISSWARQLEAAGVTDMSKLRDSIKAVAGAESLVEGGGMRMQNTLAMLNEASVRGTKVRFSPSMLAGTGVSEQELLANLGMTPQQINLARKQGALTGTQLADAMVKAINAKSAGPLAAQMEELSTLGTKASDSFKHLFELVDTGPLVDGVKALFSVIDTGQPSGIVLRDTLTAVFNGTFVLAGKLFTYLKDAFLHLMIWALQAAIALKPIVRSFIEWGKTHDLVGILLTALKGVGILLGGIVVVGAAVAASFVAVDAALDALYVAAALVIGYLVTLVPRAGEALGDLAFKAVEAGMNFIRGFADSIKNGVGIVVEAVRHMGLSAWHAIKSALGISSPSTLMIRAGLNTSEGFALGMQRGTPRVEQSGIEMSTAAYMPERSGRAAGVSGRDAGRESGGRSVTSINLGGVHVVIHAGHATTPQQHQAIVEEEFASLAERLALMIGSAPEPA